MKNLNNIAIIIFGVLAILITPVCLWGSAVFNEDYSRWQAATNLQTLADLQSVDSGRDLSIVGILPSGIARPQEGLVIYEEFSLKYGVGETRKKWRLTGAHKPDFEIPLHGEQVTVRASEAELLNTEYVLLEYDQRLEGFAPGTEITIFGQLTSDQKPYEVSALAICAGNREECLGEYSNPSTILIIVMVVLILAGIGMIWLGVRKMRTGGAN